MILKYKNTRKSITTVTDDEWSEMLEMLPGWMAILTAMKT
jgi:hypothetical protein